MRNRRFCLGLLSVTPLLLVGQGLRAQSQAAPTNREFQDNDTSRRELAQFDQFLDSHPEIAEQLRKDPSLAEREQFLKTHPALQTFLQSQPGIRQDLRQDPNAFMRQENTFDRNETRFDNDGRRAQLAEFDRFLDSHPEIAEQLRKDPSLADKEQFLKTHPALQTYLQNQPEIRQDLRQNPEAFMRQENNFDRNDRNEVRLDYDARRAHQTEFNRFLDDHREIAEQVRKDPSLADKDQFLKSHPALGRTSDRIRRPS